MRFGYFDETGRIASAHNDDTVNDLPVGADLLTEEQWDKRFDLRKVDGVLIDDPVITPLVDLRAQLWNKIKIERDRRSSVGYKAAGYWFHGDDKSRSQQLGLLRKADRVEASSGDMDVPFVDDDGETLMWKTLSGGFVAMTPRLAQQIFSAAEASDIAHFKAALGHKVAMESAADPEAYDYSGSWPETYVPS